VVSLDPAALREEIAELEGLIRQAKTLEGREAEVKVRRLRQLLMEEGLFADPTMKLLLFTEHKDTLDFFFGARPLSRCAVYEPAEIMLVRARQNVDS
jgi:hypothetical protein